jgi:hypothetical protein
MRSQCYLYSLTLQDKCAAVDPESWKKKITILAADGPCESFFLLRAAPNEPRLIPVALANTDIDSYVIPLTSSNTVPEDFHCVALLPLRPGFHFGASLPLRPGFHFVASLPLTPGIHFVASLPLTSGVRCVTSWERCGDVVAVVVFTCEDRGDPLNTLNTQQHSTDPNHGPMRA